MKRNGLGSPYILRNWSGARMTRRQMLRALSAAGLGAAAMPLLTGRSLADDAPMGPGGIPLARPERPVTLPLHEDPIASGLKPESGGTFNVYNWAEFCDPKVMQEFGKKYDVNVVLSTFDSMDEAITKLANGTVRPDVTEIENNRLAQAVAGKLLKPLNHDYIPNLAQNVWPSLQSPYYDVGSRYSVPYTIYSTGIGWRSDKVEVDIAKLENPWSIFWQAQKYRGYTAILDDEREALSLALLYREDYNVNTEDPKAIDQALADLLALIPICNPKLNSQGYQTLPQGASWLNHTWSGNMLTMAFSQLPQGFDSLVLHYWEAPRGKGPVQNDMWTICSTTTKPVLAHLWLNFLLDKDIAYHNFVDYNGYQPPINSITGEAMVAQGLIPENLQTTIMSANDFGPGSLQESQLSSEGQRIWQNAYARFSAG